MMKEKIFKFVVMVVSGLEVLVGKELCDLGIFCEVENGWVVFEGIVEIIVIVNLWLWIVDWIKIVVGEFNVYSFDELFEKVKVFFWEDYLFLDVEFLVVGKLIKLKLYSVFDC